MSKRIIKTILIVMLSFSVIPAEAIQDLNEIKSGETITLEDCIEYAFKHSPVIKKAQNNVLAAKSKKGRQNPHIFQHYQQIQDIIYNKMQKTGTDQIIITE